MTMDMDSTDVEVFGSDPAGRGLQLLRATLRRPHVVTWAEAAVTVAADLMASNADVRRSPLTCWPAGSCRIPGRSGLRPPTPAHCARADSATAAGLAAAAADARRCGFAIAAKRKRPCGAPIRRYRRRSVDGRDRYGPRPGRHLRLRPAGGHRVPTPSCGGYRWPPPTSPPTPRTATAHIPPTS